MSTHLRGRTFARWLLPALLVSPSAAADDDDDRGRRHHDDEAECVDLSGDFVATMAPGPECASPLAFCTAGTLTGDLVGTYAFTLTSMTPVSDDPEETSFTFTGTSTITAGNGVVLGDDTGELAFGGDLGFMTLVRVVGGDGCSRHASGSLLATGHLDPVTGTTSGTYTATFCGADDECFDPEDDDDDDRTDR